jgi:hypothetical protein
MAQRLCFLVSKVSQAATAQTLAQMLAVAVVVLAA